MLKFYVYLRQTTIAFVKHQLNGAQAVTKTHRLQPLVSSRREFSGRGIWVFFNDLSDMHMPIIAQLKQKDA